MHQARIVFFAAALAAATAAFAAEDPQLSRLREEMKELKQSYDQRMQALEKRLNEAEGRASTTQKGMSTARTRAQRAQQAATQATQRATDAQQSATQAATRAEEAQQNATQAAARAGEAQQTATQAVTRAGMAQELATKTEQRVGTVEQTALQAQQAPQSPQSSENAFNPAISLILQGTWARARQDPNNFAITGFVPSGGEVGPPRRSFGLGESELVFTANIDPYFRGVLVASFTPENNLEVEEAYFNTLALPQGLTLKAGRFLSGVGYQNEIHQHAWDFQDAPLAYKAFLGGRFQQDGVQMRWVAPTPVFVELGGEVGSGRAFPGNDQNKNGASTYALLAHLGGDIGESYAWRAGVSYLHASATNRTFNDIDSVGGAVANNFTGRNRVWIADGVLKWAPNGNSTHTNVKLQGEYFRVQERGSLTYDDTAGTALFGTLTDAFRTAQSGWYAQGVYQFMPQWRVGYRYDALKSGAPQIGIVTNGLGPTAADFPTLASYNPTRNTAMLDWSPTEFSRFRLQVAQDKSRMGATDNQIFLQYIHSLGPHGAHRF